MLICRKWVFVLHSYKQNILKEKVMFTRILLAILLAFMAVSCLSAATYYSQENGLWNTTSIWNTERDGSGSAHNGTWTGNHDYYIQGGHSITRPNGNTGSAGSTLTIEDDGYYTHDSSSNATLTLSSVTLMSGATLWNRSTNFTITTFTIKNGGLYIHDTNTGTIPGSIRNFAHTTNGDTDNGTVEIRRQGTFAISAGITWGNVIINNSTMTVGIDNAGAFANVKGDFTVKNTNTQYAYRLMGNQTTTHTIDGNLIIEGGVLVLKSGTGTAQVSVGGSVLMSGGSLRMTTDLEGGRINMTVNEDFIQTGGAFYATNVPSGINTLNVEGSLIVSDSAQYFRAYSSSFPGSGYLVITFSNLQGLNRESDLRLKTGLDRYLCRWDIIVSSNRSVTLKSDIEIGATNTAGKDYNYFDVSNSAVLDMGTYIIKNGSGTYNNGFEPRFNIWNSANLITAHPEGITTDTQNGSIQVTGNRYYAGGASYTYNGIDAQLTGNGLPSSLMGYHLTIDNPAGVSLVQGLNVINNLYLKSGALDAAGNALSIGMATLSGGSFAEGTTPNVNGYLNEAQKLVIEVSDDDISGFSASTMINETNFPGKIKRQWTIGGTCSGDKTITFTWDEADDGGFEGWELQKSGIMPVVYAGDSRLTTISSNGRSVLALVPANTLPATFKIGRGDDLGLAAFDFPQGLAVSHTLGTEQIVVTVTSGLGLDIAPMGTLPDIPNGHSHYDALWLRGTGVQSISIQTLKPWGAVYYNSNWHAYYRDAMQGIIYFPDVVFDASKADLPIILGDVDPTLPVEMSSFNAFITANSYVTIAWTSQSESGLIGYRVYRNVIESLTNSMLISGFINATNTSNQQTYSFEDHHDLQPELYYYWLECTDMNGFSSFYGPTSVNLSNNNTDGGAPQLEISTAIRKVYPNPFNPTATINYSLAKKADVQINIYNSRGQRVRHLGKGESDAGLHNIIWNGKDDNGIECSSGIYFFQLLVNKQSYFKKAMLLK